eukprot:gene29464-36524_t
MSTPLDRTLTYRLHQLHKLTDADSQAVYPERTGLSMSDGRCLTTIGTFEPLSVKELAEKANLNKGQASRGAQALVDQGLVLKEDHPGDGRGVVLTLTPAGSQVFKSAMDMRHVGPADCPRPPGRCDGLPSGRCDGLTSGRLDGLPSGRCE